jgi:diadenosine tetraphosphatase ApaH/serine/threonine PP2A family protein phosphatase
MLDRKHDIDVDGPITDLMYSVPGEVNGFNPSPRGSGNEFGFDTVDQVCYII